MNAKKVTTKVEEQESPFRVVGDSVKWDYKRGEISLIISDLDNIFYLYSKHGLNMSQVQVQNKYGFNALQWQSLKRTFDLVKDSDVFSPYSLSLVSDKAACDMIAGKIGEKYTPKNMREVVEYEDRKQTKKAYQKAIKRVADLDYRFSLLENEILDYVGSVKEVKVRKSSDVKIDHGFCIVTDLHGGAAVKHSFNLPAFNWKVLEKKLNDVAADTNQRKAEKVTVVLGGDLIESFSGLNHINSWQNLSDKNGYGFDSVITLSEVLSKWLQSINNIEEVIIISGNHDRGSSDNKEDVEGQVAKMISFILRGQFGQHFKVTWESLIARRKIDGCGYLFLHGDKGLSKKKIDLIEQYGFRGVYNIVFQGHLHTRKVIADCLTYRIIHVSSIFSGNTYSKNGGWSTLSGYTFAHTVNKRPVVIDFPLP